MLRRNNSRSTLGHRSLGRSRSSNSVALNPVHDFVSIEPSAAERDAYIAATISYLNAQNRNRASQEAATLPPDARRATLPRRNSFTNAPGSSDRAEALPRNHSVAGSPRLRRQQSVRFAGPHAGPRRALGTRASVYLVAPKSNSLSVGCMGTDSVDDENQCPGTEVPAGKNLNTNTNTSIQNDKKSTPWTNKSLHLSENDIASSAPSYRKLRKSKSMYTASIGRSSNAPNHCASGSGSGDRLREWLAAPAHTSNKENKEYTQSKAAAPELRAPKSMSFLRQSNSSAYRSSADRELAARLSSDTFRGHASLDHSSMLKPKASSIFRSRSRRPYSSGTLPRTLRNSSENSAVPSFAWSGDTLSISKQIAIRTTARKVSRSFKSRIKGLFSRPKSIDRPSESPLHQHYHSELESESVLNLDGPTIHPQGASVSTVRSCIPSFHAVPSNQQLKSRQVSFEMIRHEDQPAADEKSRVTSWTTSTVNTVDDHDIGAQENWEDRHIASIREIGNYASSPAPGLPPRQRGGTSWGVAPFPQPPLVDSQRVYSALVKRLQATSIHGNKGLEEHSGTLQLGRDHPRQLLQDESSTTIRCVRDDDDVFQDGARDSGSLADVSGSAESVIRHQTPSTIRAVRNDSIPRKSIQSNVHREPPKALPTRSSAFFGSPTCHLFRTASPYRRALRESMKASEESSHVVGSDAAYMGSLSEISLPERHPSPEESHKNSQETCAESVYSSNSSPRKNGAIREHESSNTQDSTDISDTSNDHGAATIYLNPSVYKLNLAHVHNRHVSTASSVEWKTWLSANVSKLETTESDLETHFLDHSKEIRRRPVGHVREQAEIEPAGDALGVEDKLAASPVTFPLRVVEEPRSAQSSPAAGLHSPGEIWRRKSQVADENTPPNLDRPKDIAPKEVSPLKPSWTGLRSVPSGPGLNHTAFSCFDARGRQTADLPRMKSMSSLAKSSPSREELLQKRRSRTRLRMGDTANSANSSPGLAAAVEQQSRNVNGGSPGWMRAGRLPGGQAEQPEASGSSPGEGPQAVSSKRMVDLFLSSRRRRIGSETRLSSESGEDAFI